ncbi:unnamed protein product [Caenorhabditis auriculariae]|uniref:Uncharacterized protein n=1 Tax=Caenorhabditis auriculariae TaxID=2777116 RepID=A0A8S1HKM1_9PELO|nr:unnamed protein product [Caenorhabditis auriculariae]
MALSARRHEIAIRTAHGLSEMIHRVDLAVVLSFVVGSAAAAPRLGFLSAFHQASVFQKALKTSSTKLLRSSKSLPYSHPEPLSVVVLFSCDKTPSPIFPPLKRPGPSLL